MSLLANSTRREVRKEALCQNFICHRAQKTALCLNKKRKDWG